MTTIHSQSAANPPDAKLGLTDHSGDIDEDNDEVMILGTERSIAPQLFSAGRTVETITAEDVVKWSQGSGASRLLLPPIHSSVAWEKAQVIDYWDSLLRGYPAGTMTVHRSLRKTRALKGDTAETGTDDFEVLDGQQRLATILLGHGAGQLNAHIKLWVDLGVEPAANSGLLFQLRVNSMGSQCAFPLHSAISLLLKDGPTGAIKEMTRQCPEALPGKINAFILALGNALKRPIIFQLVDQTIIENDEDYIRYVGRLGQENTHLTDDELTYSIIKHQYPELHDRMMEMMEEPAGRIASEANLVLAALRVAKVCSGWDGGGAEAKIIARPYPAFVRVRRQAPPCPPWLEKIIARPYPAFVAGLKQLPGVLQEFQQMVPTSRGGRLHELLAKIHHRLIYDQSANPGGLPTMLLARLPHQLVDVLLLLQNQTDQNHANSSEPDLLPPFVLHWLLFVNDFDKAAWLVFQRYCEQRSSGGSCALPALVQEFENEEVAQQGEDALCALSCEREKTMCALLWLQREYLMDNFPDFDPTSRQDEDLPIDLDYLIPRSKFGFRRERIEVGNSLGNFRWLDASRNRNRGNGTIDIKDCDSGLIKDPSAWNHLIEKTPWDDDDVADFQKLVDLRTVAIFENLLIDGRLELLTERIRLT